MAHYVLDVNETLSDLATVGSVLHEHGAPADLVDTWFAGVLRDGFALSIHRAAPAFVDVAEANLGCSLSGVDGLTSPVPDVVDLAMQALAEVGTHPDVAPGIRAIVDAGHEVTTFSNGSSATSRALLDRAGVLPLVGRVLSVEDGDVWKPHPAAYASAVEGLGVEPSTLTMVAVHPWDLDGAARAGLRTAWVDRDALPWPATFRSPDRRVRELRDLA